MDADFLRMIDTARSIAGIPFSVNSGFRCREHNKAVGGVPNSQHLYGKAGDIHVADKASRFIILNALLAAGFKRIGIYNSFIHADNGYKTGEPVIWLG